VRDFARSQDKLEQQFAVAHVHREPASPDLIAFAKLPTEIGKN